MRRSASSRNGEFLFDKAVARTRHPIDPPCPMPPTLQRNTISLHRKYAPMAAIFRHPASDYTQSNEGACPSTFLAGPFYLAARRAWGAAFGMTATLLLWAALSYFVLDTHTGLAVAGWLLALHQWCWGMAANEMVSRAYLRRG